MDGFQSLPYLQIHLVYDIGELLQCVVERLYVEDLTVGCRTAYERVQNGAQTIYVVIRHCYPPVRSMGRVATSRSAIFYYLPARDGSRNLRDRGYIHIALPI